MPDHVSGSDPSRTFSDSKITFSGLSATVGDPDKFNRWLASVQEAHGFKHTFIHHPHRYSHLRKFYYLIQGSEADIDFEGLNKHVSSERMRFLHPISVLSFGSRVLPPDLALEARDTLMLYRVLEETPDILTKEERERLQPLNFFSSTRLLRQEDILGYESELKRVVGTLMDATEAGAEEDSPLLAVTKRLTDPRIGKVGNTRLNMLPDNKEFLRNLLGLVCDLHVQGDLVSESPKVDDRPLIVRMTLRSPRCFSASTVPSVRRLPIVSSQSSRKPRTNGERRPLNGQRKCWHTKPGRLEQDNG